MASIRLETPVFFDADVHHILGCRQEPLKLVHVPSVYRLEYGRPSMSILASRRGLELKRRYRRLCEVDELGRIYCIRTGHIRAAHHAGGRQRSFHPPRVRAAVQARCAPQQSLHTHDCKYANGGQGHQVCFHDPVWMRNERARFRRRCGTGCTQPHHRWDQRIWDEGYARRQSCLGDVPWRSQWAFHPQQTRAPSQRTCAPNAARTHLAMARRGGESAVAADPT